jgi:phage N-6-adenine-methyltransferase
VKLEDAEEYTQALGQVVAGGWRQVALGERRDAAKELAVDGMTQREIGEILGVDHATVNRDLRPGADAPSESDDLPENEQGGADAPMPTGRRLEAVYSSGADDWATPADLFIRLDAEFGFTLDVCASETNAKCERYFTRDDDGLSKRWTGTCWMNPPYGEAIGAWMEKAHTSANKRTTVVCLVPARTDTAWWWDHARYGEVRFLRGRLRFGEGATAPFPSAVIIMGRAPSVIWWEP